MPPDQPLVAVLAAGQASRFGGGKLDADCAGKPVGQWVLDAVAEAGLQPGIIVVGSDFPAFAKAAQDWILEVNSAPEIGLGSSVALAAGLAVAGDRDLLLVLADMPLVAPEHMRALVDCGTSAATRFPDGQIGVPVCIRGVDVDRLSARVGESGAASIIRTFEPLTVIDAAPETLLDIDTPGQLARVAELLRS